MSEMGEITRTKETTSRWKHYKRSIKFSYTGPGTWFGNGQVATESEELLAYSDAVGHRSEAQENQSLNESLDADVVLTGLTLKWLLPAFEAVLGRNHRLSASSQSLSGKASLGHKRVQSFC